MFSYLLFFYLYLFTQNNVKLKKIIQLGTNVELCELFNIFYTHLKKKNNLTQIKPNHID